MSWFKRNRKPVAIVASTSVGLETQIQSIGSQLLDRARANTGGVLSRKFWSDQLMGFAMRDPAFKVQLFRFIDVFPTLKSADAIHAHLQEYLVESGVQLPPGMSAALRAGSLLKGTMSRTLTGQIESMAGKFIAGHDAHSAISLLDKRWKDHIAFSVDLLGETCVSAKEADQYRQRYRDLIEQFPMFTSDFQYDELLQRDHLGEIPRVNVSVKISALCERIKPHSPEYSLDALLDSISPILKLAEEMGVFVNFDMEHSALKDLTLTLFERACEKIDFPAGLAMQAYLTGGESDATRIISWAKKTGRQVTVRLIKGAYWDYETILADQNGWPPAVWQKKRETDACFERMTRLFVDQIPRDVNTGGVKLALGSHNLRSISAAIAMIREKSLPDNAIEMQMLHGMADELKLALVDARFRVREYVPVGEMIPGMAYFVRRLLENTSNESWLRAGFAEDASVEKLLASPHDAGVELSVGAVGNSRAKRHGLSASIKGIGDDEPFVSEPPRDFAIAEEREKFAAAIARSSVPVVANDATAADLERAIATASGAFERWRAVPVTERAKILREGAKRLRARRDELSGIVIREAGKPWIDADAEVCEAIDFCEFYARSAVELTSPTRLGKFAGEFNTVTHEPRGVCGIISPWNFPLAIAGGMTVAALVTGNTAILKPAEQTPGIAKVLCEILWESGVPREVLHFLPGEGETIGAGLVRDPRVAIIAFTGSKSVGLDIWQAAGVLQPSQTQLKRVVCEMGGKNAIIVDSSADLDEAVIGVRSSAFGYAGQKCSACSRLILVDEIHDAMLARLVESTRSLVVGDPLRPETDIGPVIDHAAAEKIRRYVEMGRREAQAEFVSEASGEVRGKPLVGPSVFSGVGEDHALAREEIFGPVLSVIRAKDFRDALRIANASEYKLTGGVFSRTPGNLELARREFRVGNLYLNRGITGALVGRQPFGGFGLSGGGTKSGGREYLLQFLDPRAVTENTLRRGFAPEE